MANVQYMYSCGDAIMEMQTSPRYFKIARGAASPVLIVQCCVVVGGCTGSFKSRYNDFLFVFQLDERKKNGFFHLD